MEEEAGRVDAEPLLVVFVASVLLGLALFIALWGGRRRTPPQWGLAHLGASSGNARREQLQVVIISIATASPPYKVHQLQLLKHAKGLRKLFHTAPILERLYLGTHIQTRCFAIPDFCHHPSGGGGAAAGANSDGDVTIPSLEGESDHDDDDHHHHQPPFFPADGSFSLDASRRADMFRECAVPLATEAASRAIKEAGVRLEDIGKIVLVTTTGTAGYPLDADVIRRIGLCNDIDRTVMTFVGCGAAINGVRVAGNFVQTNPGKHALLVCCELPSIHSTFNDTVNDAISHAIFGDGCAAVVLAAVPHGKGPRGSLAVLDIAQHVAPATEDGITIKMGPQAVSCAISKSLRDYVSQHLPPFTHKVLKNKSLTCGEVDYWVLHAGGHSVAQEAAAGLGLGEAALADSSQVLREYGNMVSASLLFVLERVMKRHAKEVELETSTLRRGRGRRRRRSDGTGGASSGGEGGGDGSVSGSACEDDRASWEEDVPRGGWRDSWRFGWRGRCHAPRKDRKHVCALGFSPGLTMQSLVLEVM